MNSEKKCRMDLNIRIKNKLLLFQERFFKISNTKLLRADKIEKKKLKETIENENKIITIQLNLLYHQLNLKES